jgi:putative esterase
VTPPRSAEPPAAGRISRRSLLIGAAGAVVVVGGGAGAAGYEIHRDPSLRARLFGCGRSPATPASDYRRHDDSMPARAMRGAAMPWSVALPRTGDTAGLPLILALPGAEGSAQDFDTTIGLPGFATAAGLRACFVSVGNVDSSYYHPRADGTNVLGFVLDELLPMVETTYGVGGRRSNRAAYGLSMGGYGALLIAQRNPELICAAAAASPAVYPTYHDAVTGHPATFDSPADWQRWGVWEDAASIGRVPVRIDCGDADPFAATARALLQRIPRATGAISSGCHADSFWRRTAEVQLRFLADRFAG